MATLHVQFLAGSSGAWRIERIVPLRGEPLDPAERLDVVEGDEVRTDGAAWTLHGTTSNIRYTMRAEADALASRQAGLRRPEAMRAALIPIRKSPAWWDLAQDERREIFEERSRHIQIGMDYLPQIARRLHHCREIGGPYDFLTWFEFAPEHEAEFDHMLDRLRATAEWRYVDREVEVRLSREA